MTAGEASGEEPAAISSGADAQSRRWGGGGQESRARRCARHMLTPGRASERAWV